MKTSPRAHGRAEPPERKDYEALFYANPMPMWVFDLETLRMLAVNEAALERYGYSREQFLALSIRDLRLAEDLPKLDEYLHAARPALAYAGVWRHRRKDGSTLLVEIVSHELDWQGRRARMVMANDVTERELSAAALRESEALKSAILEAALDAIITINEEGDVVEFNPAAERMFGYRREELIGRPLADCLVPPALRTAHRAGLQRYRQTGEARLLGRRVEMTAVRASGEEFPIEMAVIPVQQGSRRLFTGFLRDVSARKRAEAEIQALTQGLERAVEERTRHLQALNQELEAFSYSVSHDLRAPLRAIDGFSRALLEDCAERLDESGRRYLDRICAATHRMGTLIDDLLSLARVTRSTPQRSRCDLNELASGIIQRLREQEPERAVSVAIEPDLFAEADRNLARIALENLLSNAWKFTRRTAKASIEIGRTRRGDECAFFVRDNGAGFDMHYVHKLFGAFQRLHPASEFEGTGIGLATVQRIVNLHGGRVWAEGAVGHGATFYFTFGEEGGKQA